MTIKKKGDKFQLISKEGAVLGTHSSKAAAQRQETAINIAKSKKKSK